MAEQKDNNGVSNGAASGKTEVFYLAEPSKEFKLDPGTILELHKLARIFERMNLSEYIMLMQNPRRIVFNNFLAGIARGFGFSIGMSLLLALLVFTLSHMVDIPLIGKYIAKIVEIVQQEMKMRKF